MIKAAFQFTVLFVWLTQRANTPLRTGDVARQLSEEDVAAIERVLPSGEKPWLLNGDHGNIGGGGLQYVEAYLPPTSTTPLLRRGTEITVMRRTLSPFSLTITDWTVQETHSYAQVSIAGRSFDEIKGDQDINRPFWVNSRFDDDELIGLIQFVRSNPPTKGERIHSWPILLIVRNDDDSVLVLSRGGDGHGQWIKLRQQGQDWVIVSTGGAGG